MKDEKYIGCWYCDNILDHPDQIGLLYLGFPRCFVLIPNSFEFDFYTFDDFLLKAEVNWLDPKEEREPDEETRVLTLLWNFSVEQENEEERLAMEREHEDL